ncbi:MAG: DUF429 domain-containing protein [Acidobacteria bacterium]|nr:DUF429 domain-containing protein [Acidobacteriota bacterium]
MANRRGPELPYSRVAGVIPCGRRWLVASAKVHAATFAPEAPQLFDTLADVLSERPAYSAVVLYAPIGYRDEPESAPRTCDLEGRALLARRGSSVRRAPSRKSVEGGFEPGAEHLDAVTAMLLPRYREVAAEMSPYRQRVVYEGNPELSFYQLNADEPLRWSKRREEGREERRAVLKKKIQGMDYFLDTDLPGVSVHHLYDAAALMWSARRVLGHAARRLPANAEWDSEGLRMELVL